MKVIATPVGIAVSSLLSLSCSMLGLSLLAGCGGNSASTPTVPTSPASLAAYHAYGDSITYGYQLPYTSQAYPNLTGADKNLTVSDIAIIGDEACDVPTRQIFPSVDDPAPGSTGAYPLYTLMIGTNDAGHAGIPYEPVFTLCHQASIAWLAMPATLKVHAADKGVTGTGTGGIDNTQVWKAWKTTAFGSSVSFPITLAAAGPVYVWPLILDGDHGTGSYAVDGNVLGSFTTAAPSTIATQNGSTQSLSFLRIPNVTSGQHTVTFTQTSSQGTMQIVAIAAPPTTKTALPEVVVGQIPLQEAGTVTACGQAPSLCDSYNIVVRSNIVLFAGDGLNVIYAQNHTYMQASSAEMADGLHPNALGQSELRYAFEVVMH